MQSSGTLVALLHLLTQRWRLLQHITAGPGKIGNITRAGLFLIHFEHGRLT